MLPIIDPNWEVDGPRLCVWVHACASLVLTQREVCIDSPLIWVMESCRWDLRREEECVEYGVFLLSG